MEEKSMSKEDDQEELPEGKDAVVDSQGTKSKCTSEDLRRVSESVLIIVSFIVLGIIDVSRGPSLIDMAELYDSSIDKMSFIFLMGSLGSVVGATFTGWIFDRVWVNPGFFLFFSTAGYGLLASLLPFMSGLPTLYAMNLAVGFMSGSLDTGGNVHCLSLWRGREGGPWMHGIHFGFSVGAFLSPLLLAPFLSAKTDLINSLESNGTSQAEIERVLNVSRAAGVKVDTEVTYFYPLVGAIALLVSIGYLFFGIVDMRRSRRRKNEDSDESKTASPSAENSIQGWNLYTVVAVMGLFFFFYVGVETSFAHFLTPFAVNCSLQLTKLQGAMITAIFWIAFTAMRGFGIIAAMKLNPLKIMIMCFVLSILGALILVFFAEHSLLLLQIAVGVVGFGSASIYATGLLWLESYIVITSRFGAYFTIMASMGPDVLPIIMGHLIEDFPMTLMYMTFGVFLFCFVLFIVSWYLAKRYKSETERKETGQHEEEELQRMKEDS